MKKLTGEVVNIVPKVLNGDDKARVRTPEGIVDVYGNMTGVRAGMKMELSMSEYNVRSFKVIQSVNDKPVGDGVDINVPLEPYYLQRSLVDYLRRNGGSLDGFAIAWPVGEDSVGDTVMEVFDTVSVKGKDICLYQTKDRFHFDLNFIYNRRSASERFWDFLSQDVRSELYAITNEIKTAPECVSFDMMVKIYDISSNCDEVVTDPYAMDFAGEVTWSRSFDFPEKISLDNGMDIVGIRSIDFKDCTLLGVVTSQGESYLIDDAVYGRDVAQFNDKLDKIVNQMLSEKKFNDKDYSKKNIDKGLKF